MAPTLIPLRSPLTTSSATFRSSQPILWRVIWWKVIRLRICTPWKTRGRRPLDLPIMSTNFRLPNKAQPVKTTTQIWSIRRDWSPDSWLSSPLIPRSKSTVSTCSRILLTRLQIRQVTRYGDLNNRVCSQRLTMNSKLSTHWNEESLSWKTLHTKAKIRRRTCLSQVCSSQEPKAMTLRRNQTSQCKRSRPSKISSKSATHQSPYSTMTTLQTIAHMWTWGFHHSCSTFKRHTRVQYWPK